MIKKYPKIENADDKLRELCLIALQGEYDGDAYLGALRHMENELAIIKKQGSASGYIIIKETLNAVNAKSNEFYFKGTLTGSLISYLLGFSYYDPLIVVPKVYPEFTYGYDGCKHSDFEMTSSKSLSDRLMEYFENYPGELPIEYRRDSNGEVTGVFIGNIEERDSNGSWRMDNFHLSFSSSFKNYAEHELFTSLFSRLDDILNVYHPKNFSEYVKCIDLIMSSGTWNQNVKDMLSSGEVSLDDLIADREDVFELLLAYGIDRMTAYGIADDVRMGRINREGWKKDRLDIVKNAGLPTEIIEQCEKIKYLWTRPHTIAMLSYSILDGHNEKMR